MKLINSATIRSALAIILGFILVLWPELAMTYLVITIGILFILPGVFSILSFFTRNKEANEPEASFPIEGAGSILFGGWLVIMPEFFVSILMYILGALLALGGLIQIISLVRARKWSKVGWGYYIVPLLLFITGVLILAHPFSAAANTFVIFGVASIVYGFTELINFYKFRKKQVVVIHEVEDVEEVENIEE